MKKLISRRMLAVLVTVSLILVGTFVGVGAEEARAQSALQLVIDRRANRGGSQTPCNFIGGARGPLGPQSDLWVCVDEFEAYLRDGQVTLGTNLHQTLGLGVMPRPLSYNPCATVASRGQRVRSDRHGVLTLPLTGSENGLVQIRVQPRW